MCFPVSGPLRCTMNAREAIELAAAPPDVRERFSWLPIGEPVGEPVPE
ncbi:MAG: hypothetical protein JWR63_3806 [Conexibacter sp.]|nr:hypothetical protein [Conexibacter sp.]